MPNVKPCLVACAIATSGAGSGCGEPGREPARTQRESHTIANPPPLVTSAPRDVRVGPYRFVGRPLLAYTRVPPNSTPVYEVFVRLNRPVPRGSPRPLVDLEGFGDVTPFAVWDARRNCYRQHIPSNDPRLDHPSPNRAFRFELEIRREPRGRLVTYLRPERVTIKEYDTVNAQFFPRLGCVTAAN